jgi:hypothetical protein
MGLTRKLALIALAGSLALGVIAVGCGDDDEGSEAASTSTSTTETADASEVTVTAEEYTFDLSATPTAETEEVVFDNQGKKFHVMIFARVNEGFTTEEAIELEGEKGSAEIVAQAEAEPGATANAKVRGPLEPGDYAMICPIQDKDGAHYELGQLEEFAIE